MKFNDNNIGLNRIAKEVQELLKEDIDNSGVFYRIFYRCKTNSSISKKISHKGYDGKKTYLRDIIGIRIVFYFSDDLDFIYSLLKRKYSGIFLEESIDPKENTVFKPMRINLVFKLPQSHHAEFRELIPDIKIDNTFELQLRTVFSEGWHEIEHDLRYKFQDHWSNHDDLSRTFNGVLASLENNDWSILALFEQLSYRHYKSGNFDAMIRTKFRIRFVGDSQLKDDIVKILKQKNHLSKEIYKLDRKEWMKQIAMLKQSFPLTIDNFVYFINYKIIKDDEINEITPAAFKYIMQQNL